MKPLSFMAAAAIAAMAIYSCDEDTMTIGQSLTNESDKLDITSASYPVSTRTWRADSVFAMSGNCYLGRVRDPETGATVKSDFTTQFHVLEKTYVYDESLIAGRDTEGRVQADSCQIILYLQSPFRSADSLSATKLRMAELQRPMEEGVRYYSNYSPVSSGLLRSGGLTKGKVFSYENTTDTDSARASSEYFHNITISLNQPYTDREGVTYNNYGTYLLRQYFDHPSRYRNSYVFSHEVCPGFFFEITDGLGFHAMVSDIGLRAYYTRKPDSLKVLTLAGTSEVLRATHVSNNEAAIKAMAAETEHTYLKSPAGLFTEVTLPVKEIKTNHERDSLIAAELTFQRLNNESSDSRLLNTPQSILMVRKDSLTTFFENNQVPDNKTSYYTTYSSSYNYYAFRNISSLITELWNERERGIATNPNWEAENPGWNKVLLVPITYSTSSSSTMPTSVQHDMSLTSTRLVGGPDNKREPVKVNVVFAKFK